MLAQDTFGVTRRALDVEDYIDILRRHKGWIFGPAFLALVASVVGVYLWPDTYVSVASIKVVPQQVPENFVQSNVNQLMSDRISSMAQSILSRGVLTTVIQTYSLFPRNRDLPMDDLVEKMRSQIKVSSVQNVAGMNGRAISAFEVSFAYENRNLAQRVVSDLVSRFIDQNLRERNSASVQTTQFLKDEVDAARKRLEDLETKLAHFQMENQGHLPDQMQGNIQQLGALQARMTSLNDAVSRISQEKLLLESQIRTYKDQLNSLTDPVNAAQVQDAAAVQQKSEKVAEADREINSWENQIAALLERYKESHPDVQHARAMLKIAQTKREAAVKEQAQLEAQTPKADPKAQVRPVNPVLARERRALEAAVKQLQSQIEAKNMESENYGKDLDQLGAAMKTVQSRIESTPIGSKEYSDLLRDRDLAKQQYQENMLKLQHSELATTMEGRKQGETLELLDTASLPQTPTEPKRPIIIAVGSGIGLVLGIVLAGAREMKNSSLKNLKDVRAYTQLAILGSIPLLENDLVVRRRRRIAWLSWATAGLVGVAIMSGSVVFYYATRV